MALEERQLSELERVAKEQAALSRVATLVGAGATEDEIASAVSFEIGELFGAQRAAVVRWDGDTIQAIGNAEARRETESLLAEQSSLRQIATLVAAGRPQGEVLDAVAAAAGTLFGAAHVTLVRWEGVQDEVVVSAAWSAPAVAPVLV